MAVVLLIASVALFVASIYANRRFVAALRERYGYRLPGERYIEDGDLPMPSAAEFGWITRVAWTQQPDRLVERWRRRNIVLLLLWVLVSSVLAASVLWSP